MNEVRPKCVEYLDQGLRQHGFVVLDADVAFAVSDLWPSRQACGFDISTDRNALRAVSARRGAQLLQVSLAGRELRVPLLAMSRDALEQRIEWITGKRASGVCPLDDQAVETRATPPVVDDQPPAWQCEARRQWFESRGLDDPNAPRPRAKPAPATGYRAS